MAGSFRRAPSLLARGWRHGGVVALDAQLALRIVREQSVDVRGVRLVAARAAQRLARPRVRLGALVVALAAVRVVARGAALLERRVLHLALDQRAVVAGEAQRVAALLEHVRGLAGVRLVARQ